MKPLTFFANLLVSLSLLALCAVGARAQSQVPAPPPLSTGIRLPDPELKKGQSIGDADVEGLLKTTIGRLTDSFRLESAGMPESSSAVLRETVISGLPVGFGTLQSTRNVNDPGPTVGPEDPRVIPLAGQPFLERLINRSNLLPVGYLASGVNVARAVARVAVKFLSLPEAGLGTGFMISPTVFMTNNHVIGSPIEARKYELQFNYQYSDDGSRLLQHVTYELDPESLFMTDKDLDFTLVAVKPRQRLQSGSTSLVSAGDEFGFVLMTKDYFYSVGQLANVVQHPNGQHKQIAIQENQVVSIHKTVIRYVTDTEPGSSGSPVFNNLWHIVALHHSAGDRDPKTGTWLNNEGVRVDAIIDQIVKANPPLAKQLGL